MVQHRPHAQRRRGRGRLTPAPPAAAPPTRALRQATETAKAALPPDAPAPEPTLAFAVTQAPPPRGLEVPADATEEQREVLKARAFVLKHLHTPAFLRLYEAMIGFRRGYAVAHRELAERLEKLAETEEVPALAADFFAGVTGTVAREPFDEHLLIRALIEHVFPWLADAVDRHTAADAARHRETRAAAEEARRARPVPIGLVWLPGYAEAGLPRGTGLVLAGRPEVTRVLLDRIAAHATATGDEGEGKYRARVLRFADRRADPADPDWTAVLPPSLWAGCCDTRTRLAEITDGCARPDLVVCDDLTGAWTRSYTGRPAGATAGDAYRRLMAWCSEIGAALVAAVPEDSDDPDVLGPAYESLRVHAQLVPVRAESTDAGIRAHAGAAVVDLTAAAVEAARPPSRLIVPPTRPE